jgi:hypothetical protein
LTVAARACAAAWAAAKARKPVRFSERGGIRHAAVLQVTEAARGPWPVIRTVQARPGTRSVEDVLEAVVTAVRFRCSAARLLGCSAARLLGRSAAR